MCEPDGQFTFWFEESPFYLLKTNTYWSCSSTLQDLLHYSDLRDKKVQMRHVE